MAVEIIADQREMVKYSKSYRYIPGKGMKVYAIADGNAHEADEEHTINAKMYAKKIWIFRLGPKSFYINEIRKRFEIDLQCHKFGLSGGVRLAIEPETKPRSITLLYMKCGEDVTEGNEIVRRVTKEQITEMLQESFDSAVDKTGGQAEDKDYFDKLLENVNKSGEFLNFDLKVVSIEKLGN